MSPSEHRPTVLIVSPQLARSNSGNWRTASRWARLLSGRCRTAVAGAWQGEACDVLIALHARRSAASIVAFAAAHPRRPCVVVLTGTDLYRDIRFDASAQVSLQLARHLVVLQDQGLSELPEPFHGKARVIYQSARALGPTALPRRVLRVVSVGHLREEKDPLTFLGAVERLRDRRDIRFELVGSALDPALGRAVTEAQSAFPNLRWLGALPHAATRKRIQHAHLLVNTSRMEGGAHAIVEAAQSGTAVLASRIPGNLGMLGRAHPGYFDPGDDTALARLIEKARDDAAFMGRLRAATVERAHLFAPAEERRQLRRLIEEALGAWPLE